MKWHPVIEGHYRYQLDYPTVGNELSQGGNMITHAMRRAIELRREPQYADVWERDAVRHTIIAVHAARQLGLIDAEPAA